MSVFSSCLLPFSVLTHWLLLQDPDGAKAPTEEGVSALPPSPPAPPSRPQGLCPLVLFFCLPACLLPVFFSTRLSFSPSVSLPVYSYLCLFIFLPVCLSLPLSVCHYLCLSVSTLSVCFLGVGIYWYLTIRFKSIFGVTNRLKIIKKKTF